MQTIFVSQLQLYLHVSILFSLTYVLLLLRQIVYGKIVRCLGV